MKTTVVIVASLFLVVAPSALGGNGQRPGIRVSWFSQQDGHSRAGAGARIDVHEPETGHPQHQPQPSAQVTARVGTGSSPETIGGTSNAPPPQPRFPPLAESSSLLKKTEPAGPGSFWYQDGAGHVCMYAPSSVLPCFTVIGSGNGSATLAPLSPATIAAHVAEQISMGPGELKASPSNAGLTGAASWFWLDPAPSTQRLSLSLGGEGVTVTATPQIMWQFGDGSSVDGGPGVPYQAGPVPSGAITHVYETRCLPGDQGHDPYVLSSCDANGYQLVALVRWQISYRADGPVAATGTLPTRTTSASVAYPVSEARAFLVEGTAG